jgi:hypothetical protein
MQTRPHCGYDRGLTQVCIKVRVPKVHCKAAVGEGYSVCGIYIYPGERQRLTTDKSHVTCLSCKGTKVFREGE